jgi:hypothetical protein
VAEKIGDTRFASRVRELESRLSEKSPPG